MKKFLKFSFASILGLVLFSPIIVFGIGFSGLVPDCNTAPGTVVKPVPATDAQGNKLVGPVHLDPTAPDYPNTKTTTRDVYNYSIGTPCGFNELTSMVNKIINFITVDLATPIFAIVLCIAGFMYIFDQGSETRVKKAKSMMLSALYGFLLVLAAWLIVKTILMAVGFPDAYSFLK